MVGAHTPRQERGAVTSPTWLRFGFLLALGEAVVLVLVVLHPGAANGSGPTNRHLSSSVRQTRDPSHAIRALPRAPTTTVPVRPTNFAAPTPVAPTAVVPTAVPTTTTPPGSPARAVDAPLVLAANIAPQPNFLQSCSGAEYDDSQACVGATLEAIANGRSHEGLPPMVLPTNWAQLSPDQQIFVVTNLERTIRGLPPLAAMSTVLDLAAQQAATQNVDPAPPSGFAYTQWGSNWAGAVGNPLEAMYFWMYDDGASSANIDCTSSNRTGCWGHRENILIRLPCTTCVIGTGWDATGYSSDPSMTELLVETSGTPTVDLTWRQESAYLP